MVLGGVSAGNHGFSVPGDRWAVTSEQRVAAAHELGHLIRHKDDLKPGAAFKDHDIYDC